MNDRFGRAQIPRPMAAQGAKPTGARDQTTSGSACPSVAVEMPTSVQMRKYTELANGSATLHAACKTLTVSCNIFGPWMVP